MLFLYLFLTVLLAGFIVRQWLSLRQIRYVLQHRLQVPAPFAERISAASHQRAAAYTVAKEQLSMLEGVVSVAFIIGLTLLGGLQALDSFWAKAVSHELWRQVALVLSVMLLSALIDLPFSAWRSFKTEAKFGFNRLTPALFIRDTIVGLIISLVLGGLCLIAILSLMQMGSNIWPLYAWAFWVVFTFFIIWAYPSFIAPLFNRFSPLDRPSLQNRITSLVQRCGFTLNGLFVMDGSKRSAHSNAYFTGLGSNKRIVFFDTLLNKLNDDEIEAVLAHELGHFKHHHIRKLMLVNFTGALIFFFLLSWLSQKVWFYVDLGVMPQLLRPNDGLALSLFLLCVPVFSFWFSPTFKLLSRKHEYEADAFAAQHSSATALCDALVKLSKDNASTLTPDPLYSAFYDTHPTVLHRIQHLQQHELT